MARRSACLVPSARAGDDAGGDRTGDAAGTATEQRPVAGIDRIVMRATGELIVRQGPSESLTVEAEPRLLPQIASEVSVLSTPQPLAFANEADALAKLHPGIDGVIFTAGGRRSTFLPQVWEQLPTAFDFMARLKQKAGLPADYQAVPMLNFANIASEQKAEQSIKLMDAIYQRAAAGAGSFLSPEELGKFQEFRTTAINNSRGALNMNRAMMAPISNN